MLANLRKLGPGYGRLAEKLPRIRAGTTRSFDLEQSNQIVVAAPVVEGPKRLGTLLIFYSKTVFVPRFLAIVTRAGGIALLILAVLLPINWYWGRRMALPLMQLSSRMGEIGTRIPDPLDPAVYPYRDELGQLFAAFGGMVMALREGERLKDNMVQSQRLAAAGRLAAGIAHEINNPLAGMLTAVDTLKQRPGVDPRVMKTIGLLERGLIQIRDTVQALLVDARTVDRFLAPNDIEDMRMLLQSQLSKKRLSLKWHNELTEEVALPAAYVRQVVINLLLNAVQATHEEGRVECAIELAAEQLCITVANTGAPLMAEQMAHLFEPFATNKETGHGLGLWVIYQIVQQLEGRISAENRSDTVCFIVQLPVEHRQ
ncbi:MAG TPA: two-component sensor histidine kinase [Betaproteobacteria bacterium]|nr:two-component sensor histidine kinase [Betaproteobacteria bacterium]